MNKIPSSFAHLLLLSSLIACLAVFGACKKDEIDKTYYIRFKTDDNKNLDYTAPLGVYATFETIGQYSLVLTESSSLYNMKLQANDFIPIDTGTYQAEGIPYNIQPKAYINWRWGGFIYESYSNGGDAKITISEITSTTVRGTFSGTVQASGQPDLVLFDGEFFLPRTN